jgi:uncharacterized membrane protein
VQTTAIPDGTAWRAFAIRLMTGAGVAALGAGIIFFVAANWKALGTIGHFVLLESLFAAGIAAALWRPPPQLAGRTATAVLVLLTGALLALFGQSYQTGADVYELFFAWAALALPFALGGRSGAVWAIWWIVLDTGLALFFGWPSDRSPFARGPGFLDGVGTLLVPFVVNLAGAAVFIALQRTSHAEHSPRWLVRLLLSIAFAWGTFGSIVSIMDLGSSSSLGLQGPLLVMALAIACLVVGVATHRAKRDVFPMALVFASAIAVSTTLIAMLLPKSGGLGFIFILGAWVIFTSWAAGFLLTNWFRTWQVDDARDEGESKEGRPWYVSLLLGVAGWFAGLLVLIFVALLMSIGGPAGMIVVGVPLIAGAAALYSAGRDGIFVTQLALAFSIAGQCFVLFGTHELFFKSISDSNMGGMAFLAAVLQTVLAVAMPNRLHRAMSTFFACLAWGLFMKSTPVSQWMAAGWLVTWLPVAFLLYALVKSGRAREGDEPADARRAIAQPVATGLIIGLAFGTLVFDPSELWSWSGSRNVGSHSLAILPLMSAFAALGGLCAAFALGKRGLTAACIFAALAHVSHFYYAMDATLLAKSVSMVVLGSILLAGVYPLRKHA